MIGDAAPPARRDPRTKGLALALACVLLVGAVSWDARRERLRQFSPETRAELAEVLRRFDTKLTPATQQAVRNIDERLESLPSEERQARLDALRRFHNWLALLPDRARDELLAKGSDQRAASLGALVAKYPLPSVESRDELEFLRAGGGGPFELAAVCKIWFAISPEQRKTVEETPPGNRREQIFKLGRGLGLPREIVPADFQESRWVEAAEARIKEVRGSLSPKEWISKIEEKITDRGGPFVRRLAESLYVQEHVPDHAVSGDHMAAFFAALPSWIQSAFYTYPGDTARKRLGFVYRQLYPTPREFEVAVRKAESPPKIDVKPKSPPTTREKSADAPF